MLDLNLPLLIFQSIWQIWRRSTHSHSLSLRRSINQISKYKTRTNHKKLTSAFEIGEKKVSFAIALQDKNAKYQLKKKKTLSMVRSARAWGAINRIIECNIVAKYKVRRKREDTIKEHATNTQMCTLKNIRKNALTLIPFFLSLLLFILCILF